MVPGIVRPGTGVGKWRHVADRIEALDGELSVDTSDAGTVLQAAVPLAVAAPGVR